MRQCDRHKSPGRCNKNILITPEGSGFTASPAQKYVRLLAAQGSVTIPFEMTPSIATNVTFNVRYQNGDTTRASDVVLPITLDLDKTAASPVVNNIALVSKGTYYDINGDITNAGITDAKGRSLRLDDVCRTIFVENYGRNSLFHLFQNFTLYDYSSSSSVLGYPQGVGNSQKTRLVHGF